MKDSDCIAFLQWALPCLGHRWPGYREVRRQVCKRVDRRIRGLGLAGIEEYRAYLDLFEIALPELRSHATAGPVRFWSAGCAGGEEAYTLSIAAERRDYAFEPRDAKLCLRSRFREDVEFRTPDIRREMPQGPFHLVLCRYLAFTYFEEHVQRSEGRDAYLSLGKAARQLTRAAHPSKPAPGVEHMLGAHCAC